MAKWQISSLRHIWYYKYLFLFSLKHSNSSRTTVIDHVWVYRKGKKKKKIEKKISESWWKFPLIKRKIVNLSKSILRCITPLRNCCFQHLDKSLWIKSTKAPNLVEFAKWMVHVRINIWRINNSILLFSTFPSSLYKSLFELEIYDFSGKFRSPFL